jgi:hypothetical protein
MMNRKVLFGFYFGTELKSILEIMKENKTITVQSAFEHIDNELKKEYIRDKQRYMEKWGLRSIKTSTPKTALESWIL